MTHRRIAEWPTENAAFGTNVQSRRSRYSTVVDQLRRPRLEKVAGGPVAKAVVHGHALVPGLTEWLVARRSTAGG